MEPTILRFILLIAAEFLFIGSSLLSFVILGVLIMRTKTLKNEYALLFGFIATVVTIAFMMVFMKILTGEYYFTPFVIIFAASVILMMVMEFIWLIFGSTNISWFGTSVWAGYEFKNLHPKLNVSMQLCSYAIFIIYPAYIGYGFFGDMFASVDWKKYVLQSTLIILIGVPWLTQIPNIINLMISKNVMEGTRSRVFISQLVNSVSILLFLSLFFWATNTTGTTISLLGEYFVFSTTVTYAVVAYIIIVAIIPYIIGHFRAKHWTQFLQLQQEKVRELVTKAFSVPNTKNALKVLNEAEALINQSQDEIYNDESMILAYELAKTNDIKNLVYRIGLENAINGDPRFIHINNLNEALSLVVDCKSELEKEEVDKDKREILDAYLGAIGQHKEYETQNAKAWGVVLIATLVGSILSPVISSIGKLVASQLGLTQQ